MLIKTLIIFDGRVLIELIKIVSINQSLELPKISSEISSIAFASNVEILNSVCFLFNVLFFKAGSSETQEIKKCQKRAELF